MRTSTFALLSGVALTRAEFLTPAGGEVLEVDKEVTVQWETEGLVEPLDISLVPAGGDAGADETQDIASGIGNSGSVSFTPGVEAGDFELALTDSEGNTVISDAFSIGDAGAAGDGEDEGEGGESNGDDAKDEEASDSPASQVGGLDQVSGSSDETGGEDFRAGSQDQDDRAPPAFEPAEEDEVEGSEPVPGQGDGGVPVIVEPPNEGDLDNGEVEVEDGENEDANEVAESLNPDTGDAVAGDAGDDDSNAGDSGGPPGSFIPLSGDQLTIFPTLSNDDGADAPAQATEEAVETSTVDGGVQTASDERSETEPAEPTAVSSLSDGLAVSTSTADVNSEITSAVIGDISQTDALELEPASSTAVTTDAAVGLNPIGAPGAEITSTVSDEASLDDDADTSTDTALTSDATQGSSATDSAISDDSLAETSDSVLSASTADTLSSSSASDLLSSTATDDTLVSATDVARASSSDSAAQTATSDGILASLSDEVSATLTDEEGSPVSSSAVSTTTGDVPTPVGSGDSEDSDGDEEDLENDDEEPNEDSEEPDTETDYGASGVPGPTTFTTDIVGTGTITDGVAEATVSQAGANAGEATDSPGGSAGKMSGKSAMLGITVLLGIWML